MTLRRAGFLSPKYAPESYPRHATSKPEGQRFPGIGGGGHCFTHAQGFGIIPASRKISRDISSVSNPENANAFPGLFNRSTATVSAFLIIWCVFSPSQSHESARVPSFRFCLPKSWTIPYGGSVMTASTFGNIGSTSIQSARYSVAFPMMTGLIAIGLHECDVDALQQGRIVRAGDLLLDLLAVLLGESCSHRA